MSSGMNLEEAKEYAETMSYRKAINNIRYAKGIAYKKATWIKLRELAEIADRLVTCGECIHRKDYECDRITLDGTRCGVTDDWFCADGERNSSEKPNNCEHITEDGVTCAKYPACDDCLDNPLNKVKGSERLVKGSEKPNNSEIPTGSERSSE